MHQADCWRCFWQRKCLWNKLIQAEVFWFRRGQHVMKVTSVLFVPQHQSRCFLTTSLGDVVFTTLTLLTRYQLASCVRLQCWAEKRPFPRLRALDKLVVGILRHLKPMCSLTPTNQRSDGGDLPESAIRPPSICIANPALTASMGYFLQGIVFRLRISFPPDASMLRSLLT